MDVYSASKMEKEKSNLNSELKQKILQIFSEFMTRVSKLEELVAEGNRLFVSFQQGLEFVRRPPIDKTSELLKQVIKANETKRVLSYTEGGCMNTHDSVEYINKLHTCLLGLSNTISEGKSVVNELECLVGDVRLALESDNGSLSDVQYEDVGLKLDPRATSFDKEERASSVSPSHEFMDYAVLVAIVYSMVKQDMVMQEKIVSSLNLKTSSGELEGYSLMWSLRPYINDEIMSQAWKLVP